MRPLITKAIKASAFARDWRDRRIAHRDLALLQSPTATPLAEASRAAVELHYFHSEPMTFDYASPSNDAEALLYHLNFARMIQHERDARLKAGTYRPEDFTRPPTI